MLGDRHSSGPQDESRKRCAVPRTADGRSVGAAIEVNAEWAIDKGVMDKRERMIRLTSYSRRLLILVGEYRMADADTIRRVRARKSAPFDAILYVEWDSAVHVGADPGGAF